MSTPVRLPPDHEPYCIHSKNNLRASACKTCMNSLALERWRDEWRAWHAANAALREVAGKLDTLREQ